MKYVEARPPRELRPFLECFWCVWDGTVSSAARGIERVVPDGCPELIVHLGDPFSRQVGRRFVRQPRMFLAGTLSRPWTLRPGRRVRTLGIRFRPGGVPALFRLRMQDATDREMPLRDLVGEAAVRRLFGSLGRARTTTALLAVAESWMLERLGELGKPPIVAARPAIDHVLAVRGQIRMQDLARESGLGPRRLERAFADAVGIRPKLFARIVRLNEAIRRLAPEERAAAVEVALDAGYFDQAHLLRDFRTLAGRTPRRGGTADGEMARHFTLPKRLATLLAGD